MKIKQFNLWENTPGSYDQAPTITAYIPEEKQTDSAIVIFPGGGYACLADYEGDGYARFLVEHGITSFVVTYRVSPHRFPLPLLDARRSVRFVRHFAEKYGIDKNKIAVMGSSAGGHLASLVSTYYENIDFEGADEIDKEDFIPNAQILCYPVIRLLGKGFGHLGSGYNLLYDKLAELGEELTPELIASDKTPVAFMWHTSNDEVVDVRNTLYYSAKLHELGIQNECHIFPSGNHGLGIAADSPHNSQWTRLLLNWLTYIGF